MESKIKKISDYKKQHLEDSFHNNSDYSWGKVNARMHQAAFYRPFVDMDDYYYAEKEFFSRTRFLGEPIPALPIKYRKEISHFGGNLDIRYGEFFKKFTENDIKEIFPKFTKQQQNYILWLNSGKCQFVEPFWDENKKKIAKKIYDKTKINREPISREDYYKNLEKNALKKINIILKNENLNEREKLIKLRFNNLDEESSRRIFLAINREIELSIK